MASWPAGATSLSIERLKLPERVAGCEECLAEGTRWVHLRMCQTCGHIGCCDNSPGRHATAHHAATGHPIIRSAEPGEDWSWCYVDELMFAGAPVLSRVRSAGGAHDGLGPPHDAPAEHLDRLAGRAGRDVVRLVAQPAAQDGERR